MVRVPHHDPEPALREPQGLELVEMVDGSKGQGREPVEPAGRTTKRPNLPRRRTVPKSYGRKPVVRSVTFGETRLCE